MQQILDLHIHSRYSRACSPSLNLVNIDQACRIKGIDIIATSDFTYPAWFRAIKEELIETVADSGLYCLKDGINNQIKFILSTEVALIYKDGDKVRRLHLVIQAPNIAAVTELNKQLDKKYNIRSDGRPILGMKAPDLVKLLLKIHPHFLVYPAHIWTPWFAVFGSKSGFNSLEECFREMTEHIYAFETGLSSDPEMNWRLSALDKLTMLSNSDAHSLYNIGREANVMEINGTPTYQKIYDIIRGHKKSVKSGEKWSDGLKYTLEFYPEEGMYHFDGHRDCQFSCSPEDSHRLQNICPICQKPLVIGVLNRVVELADRPLGFQPPNAVPFVKILELDKIIAEAVGVKNRAAVKVQKHYQLIIGQLGNELAVLLDVDLEQVSSAIDSRIIEGIRRARAGQLIIRPGFDGQYGTVDLFTAADNLN